MTPWGFLGVVLAVVVGNSIFEIAFRLFVDLSDDDDDDPDSEDA